MRREPGLAGDLERLVVWRREICSRGCAGPPKSGAKLAQAVREMAMTSWSARCSTVNR